LSSEHPDLSLVVLCYQTGSKVVDVLSDIARSLEESQLDYELVCVANYWPDSSDATPAVIREFSAGHSGRREIQLVAEEKKGGMGWDMKSGFAKCRGRIVGVIDGDGQYPAISIVDAFGMIEEDELDLCKTFRSSRADSAFRNVISKGFNLTFRALYPKTSARDINSKPKLLKRAILEEMRLESDDWFIDAEIMIKAGFMALKVGEIEIAYSAGVRKSFVKPKDIFEFIANLLKWRIKV